jgi:hypothetical protein
MPRAISGAERRRRAAEARRRQSRRRAVAAAVAAAALVAVIVVIALSRGDSVDEPEIRGVRRIDDLERGHVTDTVDYPDVPPVGGNHSPVWQNCGFYATPVSSENAVHSLEHGAVWITFRPDLPAPQIDRLRELAGQAHVLVSPFDGLPSPVVASAWGRQLRLPSVEDSRLSAFLAAYREGPQAPESGGPCTGGVGSPA